MNSQSAETVTVVMMTQQSLQGYPGRDSMTQEAAEMCEDEPAVERRG